MFHHSTYRHTRAGLDPATRRRVWRIIEDARPGRVVVLVSHDMGEVEVLATRIGIMTFGRLRCLGDQTRLKRMYGGGYRLSINYTVDDTDDDEVAAAALVTADGSQLMDHTGEPSANGTAAASSSSRFGGARIDASSGAIGGSAGATSTPRASAMRGVNDEDDDGGESSDAAAGNLLYHSAAAATALGAITRLFPTAILDSHFPGHATFTLPDTGVCIVAGDTTLGGRNTTSASGAMMQSPSSTAVRVPFPISRVFQLMQTHAAGAGIVDWEIGVTTLDTVFQRIVRHFRGGKTTDAADDAPVTGTATAAAGGSAGGGGAAGVRSARNSAVDASLLAGVGLP